MTLLIFIQYSIDVDIIDSIRYCYSVLIDGIVDIQRKIYCSLRSVAFSWVTFGSRSRLPHVPRSHLVCVCSGFLDLITDFSLSLVGLRFAHLDFTFLTFLTAFHTGWFYVFFSFTFVDRLSLRSDLVCDYYCVLCASIIDNHCIGSIIGIIVIIGQWALFIVLTLVHVLTFTVWTYVIYVWISRFLWFTLTFWFTSATRLRLGSPRCGRFTFTFTIRSSASSHIRSSARSSLSFLCVRSHLSGCISRSFLSFLNCLVSRFVPRSFTSRSRWFSLSLDLVCSFLVSHVYPFTFGSFAFLVRSSRFSSFAFTSVSFFLVYHLSPFVLVFTLSFLHTDLTVYVDFTFVCLVPRLFLRSAFTFHRSSFDFSLFRPSLTVFDCWWWRPTDDEADDPESVDDRRRKFPVTFIRYHCWCWNRIEPQLSVTMTSD